MNFFLHAGRQRRVADGRCSAGEDDSREDAKTAKMMRRGTAMGFLNSPSAPVWRQVRKPLKISYVRSVARDRLRAHGIWNPSASAG